MGSEWVDTGSQAGWEPPPPKPPKDYGDAVSEELKIDYEMPNGHSSTAYVTRQRDDQEVLRGTDKHTDEPVVVRWTGEKWIQLPPY